MGAAVGFSRGSHRNYSGLFLGFIMRVQHPSNFGPWEEGQKSPLICLDVVIVGDRNPKISKILPISLCLFDSGCGCNILGAIGAFIWVLSRLSAMSAWWLRFGIEMSCLALVSRENMILLLFGLRLPSFPYDILLSLLVSVILPNFEMRIDMLIHSQTLFLVFSWL